MCAPLVTTAVLLPWAVTVWNRQIDTDLENAYAFISTLPKSMLLAAHPDLAFSQEGERAVKLLAGRVRSPTNQPFGMEPDWTTIVTELAPRAHAAGQVVTSNSMKVIYYLGRYDYERRVIGLAESIAWVLSQPGTTLVVIDESKIGLPSGVTAEAFAEIQSR